MPSYELKRDLIRTQALLLEAVLLLKEHRGQAAFGGCSRNRMEIAAFLDRPEVKDLLKRFI